MNYDIQGGDVININAVIPFKKFNAETIFYSEMGQTNNIAHPVFGKIDTVLYAQYDTNDLRKTAFFILDNGYQKFKGSYTQNIGTFFTGISTAEMYLTRAECYARAGLKGPALEDLNLLLSNRYKASFVPVQAATANDALTRILLERRKELVMRTLRWIDIKRLNKSGANIILTRVMGGQTYTLLPNADYYALPLPTDIINLTGMPQNPY